MDGHREAVETALDTSLASGTAARLFDDVAAVPAGSAVAAGFSPWEMRHGEPAGATPALMMRVLDQLDYGLMVVTEYARLRFANRVALRECGAAHGMRLHDGHVQPRHERDQPAFSKALAASRHGRRSMLTVRSHDARLSIAVVPMADPPDSAAPSATLLVFGRRQVCEPLSLEFFAREHRLTAAEVGVLRGLCNGLAPAQIARECGVAMSTVRSHIGSIRLKAGARSIGELVRMVTVLPPIVTLLN